MTSSIFRKKNIAFSFKNLASRLIFTESVWCKLHHFLCRSNNLHQSAVDSSFSYPTHLKSSPYHLLPPTINGMHSLFNIFLFSGSLPTFVLLSVWSSFPYEFLCFFLLSSLFGFLICVAIRLHDFSRSLILCLCFLFDINTFHSRFTLVPFFVRCILQADAKAELTVMNKSWLMRR